MHNYGHWKKTLALLVMSALSLGASSVDAMPEGGVIRSGEGAVSQNGREMTIRQDSGRLAMDWTNFNVGKDETVRFQQPGKDALALNRVTGNQQSVIDGSLLSNGHVLLVNPNGVVIGKNASIDVGGLVASTAHVKDNFMKEFGNSTGAFTLGGVSDGKIINEGTINAEGGLVALHAAKVENSGTITSNGGSVLMAAADTLTLTPDTDGKLNFTVDGKVAEASALNKGAITADGGTIVMTADSASDVMSTVVNNEGTLQARTLRKNEKGQILLEGNEKGQVEVSGTLNASGEGVGQDAGNIKVIGQKTIVHNGTNLLAKGNVNGGKIETSGDVLDLGDNLNIDAKGVNGKAGEWLLDPLDVIISKENPMNTENYSGSDKKTADSSDFTNGSASIAYNDPAATSANTSAVNSAVTWIDRGMVQDMLNAGTNVTIQAAAANGSANIIVKDDITKTAGTEATLTLDAMRNITVNGKISSTADKLNVVLNADTDGNQIGVVIINADIDTNGGSFTSASGGNVVYQSDAAKTKGYGKGTFKAGGAPDPSGHTAGTYFGHVDASGTADGKRDDRLIRTHGGAITLNGEVAIGLGGGTLTLDSGGGNVNITGIINSGNSYGSYVYGTTTWDELTQAKVDEYLASGMMPAYHYQGINYERKRVVKTDENGNPITDADGNPVYATDAKGNPVYATDANGKYIYLTDENGNYIVSTEKEYYTDKETHYTFTEQDSQNVRWPSDGTSTSVSTGAGYGYSSVIVSKGSMTTQAYLRYLAVSDPDSFLAKYMVSGATISIGGTNYTLARGTKSGVNYLGYQKGNSVVQLTTEQLTSLADGAAKRAENKDDTTAMKNGSSAYTNLVDNIHRLLASNWFEAKDLAQGKTGGGSAVNDSYLATITTILENSLTTPNGQQILWAGGMGSGVRNKTGRTNNDKQNPYSWYGLPDDPTHQNGMYWVTGPEGEANGGEGTQFYSNVNSNWQTQNYGETIYGYANWDTYQDKINKQSVTRYQPDNSAPFLTVGYGTTGKWDDSAFGGDTTIGFIKETNLANSSLNIKAGSGEVKLQGDIGKSKALDTVNIESIGAVKVGDTSNTATEYHNGTIYADHGVYINGSDVTVGGEIHSGGSSIEATRNTTWVGTDADKMDNVTINASRNLTVHGIESNGYTTSSTDAEGNTTSTTAGGKIKLVSTATATGTEGVGVITLGDGVDYNGKNTNGGVLKAASTANDSVVIDAQGAESKFKNETSSTKAIDTQGKWKIYSASPEQNTFGKNLNSVTDDSVTDAQWTSNSTKFTAADSDENKYIFQTTPTITLYVEDHEKTYGDDITKELQSYLKSREEFTGLDGKLHNVNEFTDAFTEKTYDNYISGAEKVTVTSVGKDGADGAVGTATRTGGTHAATEKSGADGKNAVYDLNVNLNGATAKNGYVLKNENATLEILKRKASITGKGTQTYGDTDGTIKKWQQDTQTNIANGSKVTYDTSVKPGSAYTDNQKGRNTADFGTYENSVSFDNLKITDVKGNEVNIAANYDLTTTGTIDVAKAKLNINIDDTSATYGSSEWTPYTYKLDKLVNGDTSASITVGDWQNGGIKTDTTDKNVKTQNVGGSYQLTGKFELTGDIAKNYKIGTVNPGKAIVNPKDIYIYTEGNGSTLSDVTWTKIEKDKLVNGDSWDNGFTFSVEPGDLISYAEKTFGIKGYVNGQPISDGTQIGNYIYHPTGIVQLTFNPIVKPDVWAHSGGFRPRNKIETSLPVFRVEDAKVGQYGTYGVEHREGEDKLVLSATGMRLPEPDQVPDEERTFTTTLSTEEGSGTFKLEYNGVSLKVHPQDKEAEEVVRAGDKTKNVSLSEKALYVGYTEMGLDLIDLKGVYIYFN